MTLPAGTRIGPHEVARQIADALEAAHEQGIIHRDLKPANIKLRSDDTVKVLDFGLAKAIEPAGAAGDAHLSQLPTITTPAMTQAGVILGTAAYMSPEQAKGRAVDKRTDIWAFGCVLFEMVTGQRAFAGDNIAEVLAAILKEQPALQDVPRQLRPLIAGCLEKDARKRLRDVGDLDFLIAPATPVVDAGAVVPVSRGWRSVLPVIAGVALGVALTAAAAWMATPAPTPRPVAKFTAQLVRRAQATRAREVGSRFQAPGSGFALTRRA